MNLILTGIFAGIAAAPAWIIANLVIDFFFLPVIRRHIDILNETLMARPLMNLLILAVDIVFWGAVFGAGYGLLYPGLERFGIAGGILWSILMFVSFSRAMIESSLLTKAPKDMNLFWFIEGLVGLVAWGAVLGWVFKFWLE